MSPRMTPNSAPLDAESTLLAVPQVNITAVLLVYNQGEEACAVIDAVKMQSYPVARLIVVDNASPSGSADQIASTHPDVELLRLQKNLGVGAGHNAGWRLALADPDCDFVWTLEHDCVPAANCLEELVQAQALLNEQAGLPSIVAPVQDNPFAQSPRPHLVVSALHVRRLTQISPETPPFYHYDFSFNGTLLPSTVIRRLGWLDERLFFMHEDGDYVQRCSRLGVPIYLVPAARVMHNLFRDSLVKEFGKWVVLLPGRISAFRVYYGVRNSIIVTLRNHPRKWRIYVRYLIYYLLLQLWDLLFSSNRWQRMQARTLALRDGFLKRDGEAKYACLGAKRAR
jgi:GT2 family glycosyltransferase